MAVVARNPSEFSVQALAAFESLHQNKRRLKGGVCFD